MSGAEIAAVAPLALPELTRFPVSLTVLSFVGAVLLAAGVGIGWWMREALQGEEAEPARGEGQAPGGSDRLDDTDTMAEIGESDDEIGMDAFARPEDPLAARSDLAEEVDDVHDLYLEIGYSPVVAADIARIRHELRDRVTVRIPDYEAFLEVLEQARDKMEELAATRDFEQEEGPDSVRRAARLLDEVWERRDQPSAVRDRLHADPVGEQLPFIERVPITQDGSIRWRTPARVGVLHKQPQDVDEYRRLLDRLASLPDYSGLPRPDAAVNEVKNAIERLRNALDIDDAYVPALLRRVEEAIEDWYEGGQSADARAQKDELDAFLLDLLALQRTAAGLLDERHPSGEEVREHLRDRAIQQAQHYAETSWMQRTWITDAVLANLIAAEVLRVRCDSEVSPPFRRHLETVATEIRSRGYDPAETIRRLRVYESEGYFVHSLAFSLLRKRADAEPVPPG